MFTTELARNLWPYLIALAALALLLSLPVSSGSLAQGNVAYIEEVRALDTNDLGLLNPAGLAFSPDANVFFVLEAHSTTQTNIVILFILDSSTL